jgi:hypothetical protein
MNAIAVRIGDAFSGLVGRVITLWETQPLAVTALITAAIDVAIAFGAPITQDQKTVLIGLISAAGVVVAHQNVTPTASPSLPSGTRVNVETAEGLPNKTVVLPQ